MMDNVELELDPSWLTIPPPFRVRFIGRRWADLPCPKAPVLPEGWRWLNLGEVVSEGDYMCDYRVEPVRMNCMAWTMTENCHPVRRRIENKIRKPRRAIRLEE